MGSALCHLHWQPDQFWRATNHELQAANEAQGRANKASEQAAQRARRGK
jgi:hypothetical protein